MVHKIVRAFWATPGVFLKKIVKHWPIEMMGNSLRFWYYRRKFLGLGERTKIYDNVEIFFPELIRIGKDSFINRYCDLNPGPPGPEAPYLIIGNGTHVGPHCFFRTANHNFSDPENICKSGTTDLKKIIIGDDVYIGAGSLILGGTDVGNHCVIAAGSVVSTIIPAYSLVAGNPARVVKRLK